MKNLILSLIFLSLLFSCDKESITPEQDAIKEEVSSNSSFRGPVWFIKKQLNHDCREEGSLVNFSFDFHGVFQYPVFYYRPKGSNDPFTLMTGLNSPSPVTSINNSIIHGRFNPDPLSADGCYEIILKDFDQNSPNLPQTIELQPNEFWEKYNIDNPELAIPRGFDFCCGVAKGEGNGPGHTFGG